MGLTRSTTPVVAAEAMRPLDNTALRDFIEKTQPALVLCGHIHEGRGIEQFGRTTVVNCGLAASGFYALATVGDRVDVELRRA